MNPQVASVLGLLHDNNINIRTREIYLHGWPEEEDPGTDFRMATQFLKNLRLLERQNSQPILIHQYNIGGDWTAGMAIYDCIRASHCEVVLLCHGIAASMGSIIVQAADRRLIMPNAWILIHNGGTGINNDLSYGQAQSWAVWEKTLERDMIEIYANRCQKGAFYKDKTLSQIKAHIRQKIKSKEDWLLTADESLEFGFVDEVYEGHIQDLLS